MPRQSAKLAPVIQDPLEVKSPSALMKELAERYNREHPDADPEKSVDPIYAMYCLARSDATPIDQQRMLWAELAKYQQPTIKSVEIGASGGTKPEVHVRLNTD